MTHLTIDQCEIDVPDGTSILQACHLLGVEVPVFCYHPRLSVAGNCRMCLVDVEGASKPVASCAMPVSEGMVVKTKTPLVQTAREGALEFLLLNHSLDCPICDQGGECDLQDLTIAYGRGRGRYVFDKRAVIPKDFGPLIKTDMNRCIHCTRCVRFADEIAGVEDLGAIHRGERMEIISYEKAFASEISGNVIDLCPVGALTSKSYAYQARSWELKTTGTIDVMDAVGSHIRVDVRDMEVMRILPRTSEEINEDWIADKARFSYDGLKVQRLDRPYIRNKSGILKEAGWKDALDAAAHALKSIQGDRIAGIVGDFAELESIFLLKQLLMYLGSPHLECRQDGAHLMPVDPAAYTLNTTIEGVEKADFALLIGTNPRLEAPLINARLRKAYRTGSFQAALLGEGVELTYPYTHLGDQPAVLSDIYSGKHPIARALQKARTPTIILGQAALTRPDTLQILSLVERIAHKYQVLQKDWVGLNILQTAASRVGAIDLGFVPQVGGKDLAHILKGCATRDIDVLYLLGADEIDTVSLQDTYVIYQGHHGDRGAAVADVILPGSAYTEKNGLYVNTEGRLQEAFPACPPPGKALEDWRVLAQLMSRIEGLSFPKSLLELRTHINEALPDCRKLGEVRMRWPAKTLWFFNQSPSKVPLKNKVQTFYQTDPISRNSPTMSHCVAAFCTGKEGKGQRESL
jgi:NADH-quinone oxidoreductase subunit G